MPENFICICERCGKSFAIPEPEADTFTCTCGAIHSFSEKKNFFVPTNSKVKAAVIEIMPKITAAGITAAVGFFAPELIPWAYPFTLKALEVTTDHALEKCGEWMQDRLYEEDNYQKQISSLFEKELNKLLEQGDPQLKEKKRGSGYGKYQNFRQYYHFCQEDSVSIYFLLKEKGIHPDIFHEDTIRYIFDELFKVDSTPEQALDDILARALELRRNFRNAILSDHELAQIWLLLDMQNHVDKQMELLRQKDIDIQALLQEVREQDSLSEFVRSARLPTTFDKKHNRFSYRNPMIGFYGRTSELKQLHAFLRDPRPVVVWTITGQGGCGKSRLALQFAKECRSEMGVVWLDQKELNRWQNVQHFEITDSIPNRTVLFICDYASEKLPQLDAMIAQLRQIQGCRFRFLLLEHAQNWQSSLKTSQYREAGECLHRDETIHLSDCPLEQDACRNIIGDFAAAYYDRTLTDAEANAIIERTQNLTVNGTKRQKEIRCLFMLLIADAYCDSEEMNHWDADSLVKEYIERTKKMVREHYSDEIITHAYRLLALATAAGELDLSKTAYPQPIRDEIKELKRLLGSSRSKLENLISMITDSDAKGSVMEPLYPDIVGEYVFCTEYLDYDDEDMTAAWHEHLSECENTEAFLARTAADWTELGLEVLDRIRSRTPELFSAMKILRSAMQEIGSYQDAEKIMEKMRTYFTHEDIDGMTAYAGALERMLELSDAQQKKKLFAELPELYPLDAPPLSDTAALIMLIMLGNICSSMGQYPLAMQYLQKALQITETAGKTDELGTTLTCSNIATIYQNMGKSEQALEYALKALEIREKLLGTDHLSAGASYNNIALIYMDMGNYPQSLEYGLKASRIVEKQLDTEHPDTATSYNNISSIYWQMSKPEQALEYALKALEIREKVLGAEHPSTGASYNNIALIGMDMDDCAQALEYGLKASRIAENQLGTEHPDTATSYNNISLIYQKMGKLEQALEYALKALEILEKMLGETHPHTIFEYGNIAGLYAEMGDTEKAKLYAQKWKAAQPEE